MPLVPVSVIDANGVSVPTSPVPLAPVAFGSTFSTINNSVKPTKPLPLPPMDFLSCDLIKGSNEKARSKVISSLLWSPGLDLNNAVASITFFAGVNCGCFGSHSSGATRRLSQVVLSSVYLTL